MYLVCDFWGQQLYCFNTDHERRRDPREHLACVHLWEIEEEGRRESDLRCVRNRTLSSADGPVNGRIGCRLPCSVKLGGCHVLLRSIQTGG